MCEASLSAPICELETIITLAVYVIALVQELANEQSLSHVRKAAGVAVKNVLYARVSVSPAFARHFDKPKAGAYNTVFLVKDDRQRASLAQRWANAPADVKQQVRRIVCSALNKAAEACRANALATLASPDIGAGHTAAQVVAAIAAVDLPLGDWPDLVKILLDNVTTSQAPNIRLCTLQAIGFTCESIVRDARLLDRYGRATLEIQFLVTRFGNFAGSKSTGAAVQSDTHGRDPGSARGGAKVRG
ncbi:MAG: hypothetical protein BJ554DRAFT_1993, partial [Olpidium bornovanus]